MIADAVAKGLPLTKRLFPDIHFAGSLVRLLRPRRWVLPLVVVLGIVATLAEGIGITLFVPFLAYLGSPAGSTTRGGWLTSGLTDLFLSIAPDQRLLIICVCIFACIAFKSILSFCNHLLFGWIYTTVCYQLRLDLWHRLLHVDYLYFEHSPDGKLYHALETQPWRTSEALSQLLEFIVSLCTVSVFLVLLLLISVQMTIIAIFALILISWTSRRITLRASAVGSSHTIAENTLTERIVEELSGMKEIRVFGREDHEEGRFRNAAGQVAKVGRHLTAVRGAAVPLYEVLAVTLLLTILLLSGARGPENLGPILVYVFLLFRLQPSLVAVERSRVHFMSLQGDVDALMTLIRQTGLRSPDKGGKTFSRLKSGIEFRNVIFSYDPKAPPALKNLSLKIPAGRTTALVGPSGAGKSTVINLLLRFCNPADGVIVVDDERLDALDVSTWRRHLALVSQRPYIFNSTVRENIAYGMSGASEEQIFEAASRANAYEFIMKLPDQFETRLGSRGSLLSDGEKQRIALARAIVRNPEILILDEATNALDSISENAVREALYRLKENTTIIVVAHRLSTVEQADHIIVLDQGKVVEAGDFPELMRNDGLFVKMYKLQHPGPSTF